MLWFPDLLCAITNGMVIITGHSGNNGTITISDTMFRFPVIAISNAAFLNDASLTNVTIADGVTRW